MDKSDDELVLVRTYQVLMRPSLLMGMERNPAILLTSLLLGIGILSFNLVTITSFTLLWLVASFSLRTLAKYDPQMIGIYRRYLTWRPYYPPNDTPFCQNNYRMR